MREEEGRKKEHRARKEKYEPESLICATFQREAQRVRVSLETVFALRRRRVRID